MSYEKDFIRYIPSFQRSEPNIRAFCQALGRYLDEITETINGFKNYSNPLEMNPNMLADYAKQYGVEFPRNMNEKTRRLLAKDFVNYYRTVGTETALRFIFNIVGLRVNIEYVWMLKSDMDAKVSPPYNFLFGDTNTPSGDGVKNFDNGSYFEGKDTFSVKYEKVRISGEKYPVAEKLSGDEVVKLPYIRITVTAEDYNVFTSDYVDEKTGQVYSYTESEQFKITQEILNYFISTAIPANVTILEISTPFQLSDVIDFEWAEDEISFEYVGKGFAFDGTWAWGLPMDRYIKGEVFGGYEFGENTLVYYESPPVEDVVRVYPANVAGTQPYVPTRNIVDVEVTAPAGCSVVLLRSNNNHFKLVDGDYNYKTVRAFTSRHINAAQPLTFSATNKTITRASGSWITDGFRVGDTIIVTNTASNNKRFKIVSLTATTLTVEGTVANESPSAAYVQTVIYERVEKAFAVALNITETANGNINMTVTQR